ncbi:MAG: nucleoside deaminase [Candidatus Krumholzibacteriota bacterium]|nr:nucleoside deaminase [Candidatus Krumholzibacteriota bacterium]
MGEALLEARKALGAGEVPVGAVIVREGSIIGRGHNEVEGRSLASAHAEMLAIEDASRTIGDWRLDGSSLYVTVEPCHMCLGALFLSRVARILFGTVQPRSGACGSVSRMHESQLYGHSIEVVGGILEEESLLLLQEFFARLRAEEK